MTCPPRKGSIPLRFLPRPSTATWVCAAALLAPAGAAAAEPPPRGEAERALQRATAILSGEATPLSESDARPDREATVAIRDLTVAFPALGRTDRRRARRLLARPSEPGNPAHFGPEASDSPRCEAGFCVHWSDRPANAPASTQFVEQVLAAAQESFTVQNGRLGWIEAKSDGTLGSRAGRGTSGETDIYITDLGTDLYGFAAPDLGQGGAKRFAYLVLDNDYAGYPSATPGPDLMRATLAHEYNHVLQFSYDTLADLWLFESTATWAEEQVYPEINDYLNFLPSFSTQPQLPLTGDAKVYGSAVWSHYLSARFGPEVVRGAWEASTSVAPRHQAVAAYDAAIGALGGRSLSRAFSGFAAVTAEWRSSTAFPDAAVHPEIKRSGRLDAGGRRLRLDNTSYRLYSVRRPGAVVKLRLRAERGVRSAVALVGRNGPVETGAVEVVSRYLGSGGRAALRLEGARRFDRITAIAVNADGRSERGSGRVRTYAADGSRYELRLRP